MKLKDVNGQRPCMSGIGKRGCHFRLLRRLDLSGQLFSNGPKVVRLAYVFLIYAI